MCCFIVPMAQAVATTVFRRLNAKTLSKSDASVLMHNIPELEKMLWGGTVMLIVDHVINGELTYQFPFFTALNEVNGVEIMFKEMLTVGLPMSVVLTAVWAAWALLKSRRAISAS